jgi:pyruvate ferredoxin oxidoreductase delta subunit
LAKNISRGVVLAAHLEGKQGISFGRYGDAPERNGIPAKSYAIVATDDVTLEEGMAKYEPKEVDVSIVVDDTLCKGIECWAWYGLQPVNHSLKPGGTLVVVSQQDPAALLKMIHRREQPYKLGILKGISSFSGMWVYKDDHTDVRVLGAIAKVLPELVSLGSVEKYINSQLKSELKAKSARTACERLSTVDVQPGQGSDKKTFHFDLLKWKEMPEGVAIKGHPQGGPIEDPVTKQVGGFRPVRNKTFKKFTTRSMRPVVNFATCTKCTLCWLNCPDGSFDVTPDATYDVNLESCCGCGICEAVCPVANCITMMNEVEFTDNDSQWMRFKRDKGAYEEWLKTAVHPVAERSHGLRYRGQYQEQVPAVLEIAQKG